MTTSVQKSENGVSPATPLSVHLTGGASAGKRALAALLRSAFADGRVSVTEPPAPERYTENVIAAAAQADVTLVVVDARHGVPADSRRDAVLVTELGVAEVVLVVNKLDLVDDPATTFRALADEYREFTKKLAGLELTSVPVSAVRGDNVLARSTTMPWYDGPSLLEHLDRLARELPDPSERPLRVPLESRNPESPGRVFSGTVVSGVVRPGDAVRVQPSGRVTRVEGIVGPAGELSLGTPGQTLVLTLADELAPTSGCLLTAAARPAEVADQFEATLFWLSSSALLRGRSYPMKVGTQRATATIGALKHRINATSLERVAASKLEPEEVGVCNLHLDRAIAFDPRSENRTTSAFSLHDPSTGSVVGAGTLRFSLRRAQNVHWQAVDVNKVARSTQKSQRPCLLWYTGLSGAGKSTIANLVDKKLYAMQRHTYLLDGDNVRHGLNKDLGFTAADRVENIRRIAEVAKLMVDAGLIVGAAFISPFRAERLMARALLQPDEFIEIFVDTPLVAAEERDPKGLYKKARRGELKNFTGIDSPYEAPESPELRIDTTATSPDAAADAVIRFLEARGTFEI